jgi:hypothetical protein
VCSARCLVEEVLPGLTNLWVRAGSPQLLQPLEPSEQSKLTAACEHAHHVKKNGTIDKAKRKSRGTASVTAAGLQELLKPETMLTQNVLETAFRRLTAAGGAATYIPESINLCVQIKQGTSYQDLLQWDSSKALVHFVHLLQGQGHSAATSGADYLLLPIHRPSHWVLMVLDLQNKTLTLLDSLAAGDAGAKKAEADIERGRAYLDYLAVRESGVSIQWSSTFPSVQVAQQYDLDSPNESCLDCGSLPAAGRLYARMHLSPRRICLPSTIRLPSLHTRS